MRMLALDVQKLYPIQAELDGHIRSEKELLHESVLDKKILALQVELGEFANELPETFKFWANKKNNYAKALKEYVDGIHFILSIGNDIDVSGQTNPVTVSVQLGHSIDYILEYRKIDKVPLVEQFQNVYRTITTFEQMRAPDDYYDMLAEFLILGSCAGFTSEQVEHAYLEKNKENHQRQVNGY